MTNTAAGPVLTDQAHTELAKQLFNQAWELIERELIASQIATVPDVAIATVPDVAKE